MVRVVIHACLLVPGLSAYSSLARLALRGGFLPEDSATPDQAAARTLLTLDLNHDGRVDASEVAAFAKTQGYDTAPTEQEFAGLDANHDGTLDMMELSGALGLDSAGFATAPAQAPAPAAVPVPVQGASTLAASAPRQLKPIEAVEKPAQMQELRPAPGELAALSDAPSVVNKAGGEVPVTKEAVEAVDSANEAASMSEPDAQAAAALIARELSVQGSKEDEARLLDRTAAELRANSTALTRQTVQRVLEAGSKAASKKTAQLLQTLTKMEDEAEEAEVQAAALRAKSKAELEQASDFMAIANAALGTTSQGA